MKKNKRKSRGKARKVKAPGSRRRPVKAKRRPARKRKRPARMKGRRGADPAAKHLRQAAKKYLKSKAKRTRVRLARAFKAFKAPVGSESIIITKGAGMAGRKRSRKKARRYGFEGRRRSRRRGRLMHGDIAGLLKATAGILAGAIGGSFAASKIPVDAKLKAAIPLVAGLALNMTKFGKSEIARNLGLGLVAIGGLSLIKTFAPQIPLLTGEYDEGYPLVTDESGAMLGLPYSGEDEENDDLMGVPMDEMSGDEIDDMHLSPANV